MSASGTRDDWPEIRLGDFAWIRTERVSTGPWDDRPYVALEHIAQGSPRLLGRGRAGDAVSTKTVFRAGDVLYGKLRPALRKVVRVDFDGVCSTEILVIFPRDPEDGSYLHQLLRSDALLAYALQLTEGTKMPRTSWEDLREFTFPLPPANERRRMGTILHTVDETIEKTQAVIEATEHLRKALLEELLTRGLPGWHTEWKHAPGIGTIPACWKWGSLGDAATIQTGRAVGKTLATTESVELPYLSVANVKDGYLDLAAIKRIRVAPTEIDRFLLRRGDVLFTEGGDADKLGRGCIWDAEVAPCLHQNHIFAVRPTPKHLTPRFLDIYARSFRGRAYFFACSKQTTNLASINSSQLRGFPIPLPSLPEQQRIGEIAAGIEERIATERAALESLQSLKQVVAEALLSGRVRVQAVEPMIRALDAAPEDDEPTDPEEEAGAEEARHQYFRGEGLTAEEAKRRLLIRENRGTGEP
jgi:type I restriction enzyme S subunit